MVNSLYVLAKNELLVFISVHAEEAVGVNANPEVMSDFFSSLLAWDKEQSDVQANVVNHTGAGGLPVWLGKLSFLVRLCQERYILIVDDFIGQGGTIVNLRGHILQQGDVVVGATVLTWKNYSAIFELESNKVSDLRRQHGQIEDWWRQRFGFGFDCLTASEARYPSNTATSKTIRARIDLADVDA